GRTNLHLGLLAEHVEKHYRQTIDSAEPRRVAGRHRVEPAATARTPRDGTVFVTPIAKLLAHFVVQLGGERPTADTRGVGLDHAVDVVDITTRHARTTRYAHAGAVAAGNERIGTVVHVEQRA